MFHLLIPQGAGMRRAILMSLIILLCQPLTAATNITENTEENSSGTFSGNYTVENGATWTISGHYEIEDESTIIVEEGGTMIVSGSINSTSDPHLEMTESSSIVVPVGYLGESGTMRIHFTSEVVYEIDIEINGVKTENFSGVAEYDWTGDMDVENITINITRNTFNQVQISHFTLSPSGSTPQIVTPNDVTGEGISVIIPDKQKAWNIEVYGDLIISGEIFGASITCHGVCTLNGANMRSSGPIEVFGTITVEDSNFNNGIIDEDIVIWDQANVTWTNSNGTGGETDNWVRILSTRTIGVENGHVWFMGYEIGYDGTNTSQIRDNTTFEEANKGDNIIEFATDKRSRIIEWRDGNGVEHQESASGLVVLSTQWGDYEQQISELPKVNHFDVSLDLPKLTFDSLVAESNDGITDERLGVIATISNSGDSPAEIFISCTANGVDADVGLTVTRNIGAGETKEIPMGWYSANEGDLTLECSIFVPDEFDGYEVVTVDGDVSTTEVVTWITQEEEDAGILMAVVIGLVVAAALYGLIWWSMNRDKTEKEHLTEIGEDVETLDEDEGVIE